MTAARTLLSEMIIKHSVYPQGLSHVPAEKTLEIRIYINKVSTILLWKLTSALITMPIQQS